MRVPAIAACAMFLAAVLSGCTAAGDEGTASVYVKDAPADEWRSVFVTFTEVSVHQSGGNATGNGTSGWHVLFSDPAGITVDLLNASGVRAAFLGEDGLPAGHYQQVRIEATSAYGIDGSGARVDIQVPEKGLRTSKSFKVEAGRETQIVIDIDLGKSLVEKKDGWEFKQKIGKIYTHVKEKADKPAKGTVDEVALVDEPVSGSGSS